MFDELRNKFGKMNRSAKVLLIVSTTLDGFSLVNGRQFAKFTPNFLSNKFSHYMVSKFIA